MRQKLLFLCATIFLLLVLPFALIGMALNKIEVARQYALDVWDESNLGKALVSIAIISTSLIFLQLLDSFYALCVDIHYLLLKNNIVINSKVIRTIFIIGILFTAFFSMKKARESMPDVNDNSK